MKVFTNQDSCWEVHFTTVLREKGVQNQNNITGKQERGLCGRDNTELMYASALDF